MTKTSATNAGRVKKAATPAAARTATAGNSRPSTAAGNGRVSTVAGSARKATAKR
ncbi:hypothetical protein [Actinoplanes auranticolor]|nr:hypothetical protein [Actinoplanes auranticolor]